MDKGYAREIIKELGKPKYTYFTELFDQLCNNPDMGICPYCGSFGALKRGVFDSDCTEAVMIGEFLDLIFPCREKSNRKSTAMWMCDDMDSFHFWFLVRSTTERGEGLFYVVHFPENRFIDSAYLKRAVII